MHFKFIMLWTDALLYLLLLALMLFGLWARRHVHLIEPWRQVFHKRLPVAAFMILLVFVGIGLLDSIHYRKADHSTHLYSVFDRIMGPVGQQLEKTYSSPFAINAYTKETIITDEGPTVRAYPRLKYAGADLKSKTERPFALIKRIGLGLLFGSLAWLSITSIFVVSRKFRRKKIIERSSQVPWRLILSMSLLIFIICSVSLSLAHEFHIFGTDKVGHDVFYQTLKSVRTGLIIGTLTTLVMLPFAILMGIAAGYFGGRIDDVIQYIYTTLSSIPGVLLIAAAILSLQVYIGNHPEKFVTLAERADARLLALCVILGVTSWTSLCRLLRGETLKLREVDFIQAARALGVTHRRIITRHILPNVMHIVLISIVLDFSGLVLAEAVLSYVGVGVDPSAISWGNMINSARLELAREPVVWWPLMAAFVMMFTLVLVANIFADSIRDAFDPRVKKH